MKTEHARNVTAFLGSLAFAASALAVDPVVSNFSINGVGASSSSFLEYTGSAAVGVGKVNQNLLYFIDEKIGVDPISHETVKSWYIFFDPKCVGVVEADITFSTVIKGVRTTAASLKETNSIFGIDVDGDRLLNDYRSRPLTGTERKDETGWSYLGDTLHISWKASNPGDHIRVTTLVPEPQTYAMMLAGLGLLGTVAFRRRQLTMEIGRAHV